MHNAKLRQLLTKGPNFREPKSLNFHKALRDIRLAIDSCIDNLVTKTKHKSHVFNEWKRKIVSKVEDKIAFLKNKLTPQNTKPVLKDPDVKSYLESLHKKYVIVTIDKAKLRQLLTKGPNFREPKSLNFHKALRDIRLAIDSCIDNLVTKTKHKSHVFNEWKRKIVSKVEDKIAFLKNKLTPQNTKPVLKDPDVKSYLESLHKKYVIVTIDKAKLRQLLTKGPNFREPKSLNFHKALRDIRLAIDSCIDNLVTKTKHKSHVFNEWKRKIVSKVEDKIAFLKNKLTPQNTKPVLKDPDVKSYLESLHKKYVIVTIDKAANNFAFICKQFYINKLLSEVSNTSPTYLHIDKDKELIIEENIKMCEKFGLNISEKQKSLPSMYWIPKMHKNPVGARFIVASKTCSTKPLTEVISNVFKMLYKHVEGFNNKSHFYSSFKKFWVVQNSFPIIKQLDSVNAKHNAKRISTFDFSTLYTTIPHCLLIDVLSEIIEFVFKSSHRNRIGFSPTSVYWTSKGKDKIFFTKTSLIEAVTFLIKQCYFTVGNLVLKQDIGIPMGIDPAPFWANLFLYFFESKFVQSLISLGSTRAYRFHSVGRFIDDLCAINDREEFLSSYKEIIILNLN